MKTSIIFAPLLVAVTFATGCSSKDNEPSAGKQAEPESRVSRLTNGHVVVTLDPATQKMMGLQIQPLLRVQLSPEVKGYGHVLDASPLASLVAEFTATQVAAAASEAELNRLKTLAAQSNASERALQAAQAAAARDQAQVEAVRLKLIATWGPAISRRQDLPNFARSLATLTDALVQVDLPAGEAPGSTPTAARLLTLAKDSKPVPAQFLGHAPVVDPQIQGKGFLFLVAPNTSGLSPGSAVTGFLSLPGEPRSGVALPRDAIVQFSGTTWIYLQTAPDTFERVEVALDRPLDTGWFILRGLKPEDKVVTAGAQQLLSEELKAQTAE